MSRKFYAGIVGLLMVVALVGCRTEPYANINPYRPLGMQVGAVANMLPGVRMVSNQGADEYRGHPDEVNVPAVDGFGFADYFVEPKSGVLLSVTLTSEKRWPDTAEGQAALSAESALLKKRLAARMTEVEQLDGQRRPHGYYCNVMCKYDSVDRQRYIDIAIGGDCKSW